MVAGARTQASLWPWAGSGFGSLPPLLVVMTVVTGIVDAVSYLALGHVFVANMTGNVVFLGFALAEAGGLSVPASLGGAGGVPVRCGCRRTARRPPVRAPAGGQLDHRDAAGGRSGAGGDRGGCPRRRGSATRWWPRLRWLGVQNAMARSLAVPDLTTTVLTLTLTGVAADSTGGTGSGGHIGRRLISVGAMFGGALVGALLVINVDIALPLAIAAALLVATRVLAQVLSRPDRPAGII